MKAEETDQTELYYLYESDTVHLRKQDGDRFIDARFHKDDFTLITGCKIEIKWKNGYPMLPMEFNLVRLNDPNPKYSDHILNAINEIKETKNAK